MYDIIDTVGEKPILEIFEFDDSGEEIGNFVILQDNLLDKNLFKGFWESVVVRLDRISFEKNKIKTLSGEKFSPRGEKYIDSIDLSKLCSVFKKDVEVIYKNLKVLSLRKLLYC